ncbi:MAG: TatD family hydrolase [Bacteroidales bacterium]
MNCINFHCHRYKAVNEGVQIISYSLDELISENISENCTVGIHPWQSDSNSVNEWLKQLEFITQKPNIIAIGEIGLDRLRGGSLDLQTKVLLSQVEIAKNNNKPIVIHCVRAWSELIKALSNTQFSSVKKAIHGFRGKAELAKLLVEQDYYLSFGSILVDPTPELAESLTNVPLNRLFFETDISEMPIAEVYMAASDILNIPIETLLQQTEKNFIDFFKI